MDEVNRRSEGGHAVQGCWAFTLYPEAAEGAGCFMRLWRRKPVPGLPDVERARAEAGRRARTKLRRYCAANRLNRLGTLTEEAAPEEQPALARGDGTNRAAGST